MTTLAPGAAVVHGMAVATPAHVEQAPSMAILLWLALILSFVALWQVGRAMAPIGVLVRAVMSALVATLTLFGLIGLLVWLLAMPALRN